jgi:membrane dipeptidase
MKENIMTRNLAEITQEQEERATRVHDNSLVVDIYGGPFSAPRSIREWRAGRLKDDGEWIVPTDTAVKDNLVPDMRAGGVDCVLAAAFSPEDIALWLREFETSGDVAAFATSAAGVRQARQEGKVSFILGAGGTPGNGVEEDLNRILLYRHLGIRIWALTHSNRNLISDGCGEPAGAGLSNLGRLVVKELNKQKILVDVSHISDQGFYDVLDISDAPIIATHSNSRTLCEHGRNLTDDMIRQIAAGDGIISLNFFPLFVRPQNATVFDLVDHIDFISEMVGPEHVGLGPDFCAGRYSWVMRSWWKRGSSDHNAKAPEPYIFPEGVEDITQMKNVTRALVMRGYSDGEIKGILGENYLRLMETVTGA